jgi:hypothetical protein
MHKPVDDDFIAADLSVHHASFTNHDEAFVEAHNFALDASMHSREAVEGEFTLEHSALAEQSEIRLEFASWDGVH